MIGTPEQQLSNNGMHQFVEVTKDGKSMIFDNMHPEGVLKEKYIEDLGGVIDPGKTTAREVTGKELIESHTKQINK